jgi:hypothetical protein
VKFPDIKTVYNGFEKKIELVKEGIDHKLYEEQI